MTEESLISLTVILIVSIGKETKGVAILVMAMSKMLSYIEL